MKRTGKKVLAWALTLSMSCSLCAPVAMAEPMIISPAPLISTYSPYSDIQGHWAEKAITRWSKYNVVSGFGSEFKPDGVLTRAQMATILSNLLGLTKESEKNPFKDVASDAWYKTYILRCYEAGVMSGDGVNANPESLVTRQEAVTMLCKALGIVPIQEADLSAFADGDKTAPWAVPYMAAMVKAGYVGGVGDGKLAPGGEMTRAASMTVLNNAIVQYINTPGEYTLTDQKGIILVVSGDVTLSGETKANILVTSAADGKSVTFDKATVAGTITVQADNATITNKFSNITTPQILGVGSKVKLVRPENSGSSDSSSGSSNNKYEDDAPEGNEPGNDVPEGNEPGNDAPEGNEPGNDTPEGDEPEENALTITEDGKNITSGTYDTVTITDTVGDGEVVLSNIIINGDLIIRGGGSDSIKLDNCTIHGKVVMDKPKEKGEPPRLELTNTPVPKVETKHPAIVEATDMHSSIAEMDAKAPVTVQGEKTQIEAMTAQANVEVKGGKVNKITVSEHAKTPVHVSVAEDAKLGELEVNAPASIDAKGSVNEVTAKADVEVKGGRVDRVTVPKDSKPVHVKVDEKAAVSDVNINTSDVTIENNGVVETLSTELETAPEVEKKGNKKDEIPEDVVKHNWGGKWVYLDDTYHQKVCSDGQHTRQELHNWTKGKVIKQPTATEDGLMEYKCGPCDSKKEEIIPAKMSAEDKLLSRAKAAGLLKYFDKVEMDGVNRLELARLITAYMGWDVSKDIQPDAIDCGRLTRQDQTIIALVRENEFLKNYENDEFKPENTVTRAEMAITLCKLIYGVGFNPTQFDHEDYFADLPVWAARFINLCASMKLFAPEANSGKFRPNDNVSMTSALHWLLNAKGWTAENPDAIQYPVSNVCFTEAWNWIRWNRPNLSDELRFQMNLTQDGGKTWINAGTTRNQFGQQKRWNQAGEYNGVQIVTLKDDKPVGEYTDLGMSMKVRRVEVGGATVTYRPLADGEYFVMVNGIPDTIKVEYGTEYEKLSTELAHVVFWSSENPNRKIGTAGGFNDGGTMFFSTTEHPGLAEMLAKGDCAFSLEAYGGTEVSNGGKSISYTVAACGEGTATKLDYALPNIRFDEKTMSILWDAEKNISDDVAYHVTLSRDGGRTWYDRVNRGDNTDVFVGFFDEGQYDAVRITTWDRKNGNKLLDVYTDLNFNVNIERTVKENKAIISYTKVSDGSYMAHVEGAPANVQLVVTLSYTQAGKNSESKILCFTDENGKSSFRVPNSKVDAVKQGICSFEIEIVRECSVSDDGKSMTYLADIVGQEQKLQEQYLLVRDSDEEMTDWIAKVVLMDADTMKCDVNTVVQNAPADFSSAEGSEIIEWIDADGDGNRDYSNIDDKIFKYSEDDDGVYTLTYVNQVYDPDARYDIGTGKEFMEIGSTGVRVDENTSFVDVKNGKAYEGYKNVPNIENAKIAYALDSKKVAKVVFILSGELYDKDVTYFFVADTDRESLKHDGKKYFEYTDIYNADGKQITLTIAYDALGDQDGDGKDDELQAGHIYQIKKVVDEIYATKVVEHDCEDALCGDVVAAGNDTFRILDASKNNKYKFDTDDATKMVLVESKYKNGTFKGYDVSIGSIGDIFVGTDDNGMACFVHVVEHDSQTAELVYINIYKIGSAAPEETEGLYYYQGVYDISNDTGMYKIAYTMYSNATGEKTKIIDPAEYSDWNDAVHTMGAGFYQVENKTLIPVFTGTHGQVGNAYYVGGDTAVYDIHTNELRTKGSDIAKITDQAVFTDLCASGIDSYQRVVDAVKNGLKVQLTYVVDMKENWENNFIKRVFVTSYHW